MKQKEEVIELKALAPKIATVTIVGDSDLVLNKMNDVSTRTLTDQRKDKAKNLEKPNMWEQIITSMHWLNGKPAEFTEESLTEKLQNDSPCISGFGLKKSFEQAVVRNEIDTYATKFSASINIMGQGDNLIPINFASHHVDEKLMSPKRGAPVLVYLNRFSGWSAQFRISYLETTYSLEQILNVINLAGFGLGIGSGRSSGYGRYHVANVE